MAQKIKKAGITIFSFAFLLTLAPWSEAKKEAPNKKMAPHELQLQVKVQASSGMPKKGNTGVDIMIFKVGDPKLVAYQTKSEENTGEPIEIPFVFKNLPILGEKGELLVKAYGTTFGIPSQKLATVEERVVNGKSPAVEFTLNLERVLD